MQMDLQRQRPAHRCAGHVKDFYFDSKVIGKSLKENATFVFQRDLMYYYILTRIAEVKEM